MANQPVFYITTPIYYVNDEPHLGHAYTTILADVLARYPPPARARVFFLTGVDEHGQKVHNAVRKHAASSEPARATSMRWRRAFRSTWAAAEISYDDFIRTTQAPPRARGRSRPPAAVGCGPDLPRRI